MKTGGRRGAWARRRRFVQWSVVLAMVLLPVSYRFDQRVVFGTFSSLAVGPFSLIDPATGVATALAFRAAPLALLGGMALPLLAAFILGPVFCSWVCPWGLFSEMLARVRKSPHRPPGGGRWKPSLRFGVLAGVLLASWALRVPLVALFSAPGAASSLPLEWIFLGGIGSGTLIVLGSLLFAEIVLPRRVWCRLLCPVGSVLALLRMPRTLTVRASVGRCAGGSCEIACMNSCPWNLDPRRIGTFSGCTTCGQCLDACPVGGRLRFAFGNEQDAGHRN